MRVAIANDAAMTLEMLSRVVSMDPECEIAWTASNGAEAVEKCASDLPDLLLMDVFMPVMDGAEAARRIMASSACPILIVTANIETGSSKVFEALGAGAMDAVKTPEIGADGSLEGVKPLLRKLSQFKRIASVSGPAKPHLASEDRELYMRDSSGQTLVVIGASTGGPNAIVEMLSQMPASVNAAFVIIQHVDQQFAPGFAVWLNSLCNLKVKVAEPGDMPERGVVLVASTNDHMVMNYDGSMQYIAAPEDYLFRPSADVFFNSVAKKSRAKGLAVLLTGIGRDGAAGLLALKNAGWRTFAQSRESCVVYGMPKAAVELGAACEVLTPKEIGARISSLLSVAKGA